MFMGLVRCPISLKIDILIVLSVLISMRLCGFSFRAVAKVKRKRFIIQVTLPTAIEPPL